VRYFPGGKSALEEECSKEKSLVNVSAFDPVMSDPAFEARVPVGRLNPWAVPNRKARRAAKYLGTSIFLIRPMAAPIVLLLA
jgi:hypothetical protein